MMYTQRQGGDTEIFTKAKQNSLDAQLMSYMAKAKDAPADDANAAPAQNGDEAAADAENLELRKTRSASKKDVIEA